MKWWVVEPLWRKLGKAHMARVSRRRATHYKLCNISLRSISFPFFFFFLFCSEILHQRDFFFFPPFLPPSPPTPLFFCCWWIRLVFKKYADKLFKSGKPYLNLWLHVFFFFFNEITLKLLELVLYCNALSIIF